MTITIRHGDCREILPTLPDASVHCCVTSPPYFGLRDYGVSGQIGLEATPDAFVAEMVAVFREVRRVLRDDGTLWLNLGDSYAGSWGAQSRPNGNNEKSGLQGGSMLSARQISEAPKQTHTGSLKNTPGVKAKDLIGIPWMVAFALRADGWYLRQDIIWHKPNPMPESVTDRCTKAHEYVFLLSKGSKYFYDADAIKEDSVTDDIRRPYGSKGAWDLDGRAEEQRPRGQPRSFKGSKFNHGKTAEHQLGRSSALPRVSDVTVGERRNKRSVWTVATQPYNEAHFATFPPALINPCIKAGCPTGGTVLDPFGGAGTTGLVADRLQRNAILIELNPEYASIADSRIIGDAGMFAEVKS